MSGGAARAFLALLPPLAACAAAPAPAEPAEPWRPVTAWRPVVFGGDGDVRADGGALVLEPGNPLTGVVFETVLPSADYEVELVATRAGGVDFFCALTVPTARGNLSLVLGGWGGAVCGLSSLDGRDAARNETRTLRHFERDRPYRVRLRVLRDRVQAFVDDAPLLGADLVGREASVRVELDLCQPFGYATYQTRAIVRDVRWRPLGR